jgi:hypothetical protein
LPRQEKLGERADTGVNCNRIAGQTAERLAALSDGVLATAMTLLLLHVRA